MPRYVVTGTKKDEEGFHEVTLEAADPEEAGRMALEKHGLFAVVSIEDSLRPMLEPLETPVQSQALQALDAEQTLRSASSAVGCLWLTIFIFGAASFLGAVGALTQYGSPVLAVGFAVSGAVAIAVPRGLIAAIELLSVLVRENRK